MLFEKVLSAEELKLVRTLTSPPEIQSFLDQLTYSADPFYRCPLRVLRERQAHCFDGALFAAAILHQIGFQPLILDMIPNSRDDDHLLALFKIDGYWGAIAKSNFVGLRYREPIFRNLRELVLSYFEQYYNVAGEKTLRGYTVPLNLTIFDKLNWMTEDIHLEKIAYKLDQIRRFELMNEHMIKNLSPVDKRSLEAGLVGVNSAGLYKPSSEK
jgi:hypothetical protein